MHPVAFRPDHRLSDWPDCYLELRCLPCGDRCVVLPVRLLRQCGDPTFAALLPRLRCHQCRAKPAPVYLCASFHRISTGGPAPGWALELVPARSPR